MELKKILREHGYINGRAICGSKTAYREENPKSVCVFNACIFSQREGQFWYGDLDLTKDAEDLRAVAFDNEGTLYILTESDAYNCKDFTFDEMVTKSVWDTTKETPIK